MPRLLVIEADPTNHLDATDTCHHIGEYTPYAGYSASSTNNLIINLKKKPTLPTKQLYWKNEAIRRWGNTLAESINLSAVVDRVTFVPAPSSKSVEHPEHDDRMVRVLRQFATHNPRIDIRPLVVTRASRPSQHEGGGRLTIDQLIESMALNRPAFRGGCLV